MNPIPLLALVAAVGCIGGLPELPDPRNCAQRQAFYPDEDGDGIGEPTQVFIGCAAPDGWVLALPQDSGRGSDTASSTGDTGTSGSGGSGAG